jgi:hypothetical protein
MLLLVGHAANQLAILTKLVAFSSNWRGYGPVEEAVTAAQTQMFARYSIGVANEAWELIHKRFVSRPLGRDYRTAISDVGKSALEQLCRYFGAQNLISSVRSNFVFHNPHDAEIEKAFETAPDHEVWDWYLSPANINTFYLMSDLVITYGIINAVGSTDAITAHEKIMEETKLVSGWIVDFALAFLEAVLAKHFDQEVTGELAASIEAPNVFGVRLPFYVEVPDVPEAGSPTPGSP